MLDAVGPVKPTVVVPPLNKMELAGAEEDATLEGVVRDWEVVGAGAEELEGAGAALDEGAAALVGAAAEALEPPPKSMEMLETVMALWQKWSAGGQVYALSKCSGDDRSSIHQQFGTATRVRACPPLLVRHCFHSSAGRNLQQPCAPKETEMPISLTTTYSRGARWCLHSVVFNKGGTCGALNLAPATCKARPTVECPTVEPAHSR